MDQENALNALLYYLNNEAENEKEMERLLSCSVSEFESLFRESRYGYDVLSSDFLSLLEENDAVDLHEKLLILISLERENVRNGLGLLHYCLNHVVSTDVISFLANNGARLDLGNPGGWTPLLACMLYSTAEPERIASIFEAILSNGGEFGLRDLQTDTKSELVQQLKEQEKLVMILKENVPRFTETQKEEWEMIRLEFVC